MNNPSIIGKNILFEESGKKIRACTPIKLVELLFSPYYDDKSFLEDVLYTFEVWVDNIDY